MNIILSSAHSHIEDFPDLNLGSAQGPDGIAGTERPTLGSKAMQCLSKLGKYIAANPKTVLVGIALVAVGIVATGGWGLAAALGVAFGKLLIGAGAGLIGLSIGWEIMKDKLELDAEPTKEEIAKEAEARETTMLTVKAMEIAFEVHFKNQVDRGKSSSVEDADLQKKVDFLKMGGAVKRDDLAKLDAPVVFHLDNSDPIPPTDHLQQARKAALDELIQLDELDTPSS